MSIALAEGQAIPLTLLLEDRNQAKFVRARVRGASGAEIAGSPVNVPHLANGLYFSEALVMPSEAHIIVEYDVFNNAGFTEVAEEYSPAGERFERDQVAKALRTDFTDIFVTLEPEDDILVTMDNENESIEIEGEQDFQVDLDKSNADVGLETDEITVILEE